ncbi:MAG: transposase [Acidimicrobiales bacterium]
MGADHLVWFVLDVIAELDLSRFHRLHPNDGVGRRAYDPEMMLALLVYAYATGTRSSRRIARGVREDLAMKVICCDVVPEHDAIGRFRADHEQAIKEAFIDVLSLCSKLGLASLGQVAIDGTKIGADAALDQNRREQAIRDEVERIMAEAAAADGAPTQPTLGGEDPEPPAPRSGRLERLRAALREIAAERAAREEAEKVQTERWAKDAEEGRRPRGRAPGDPARALVRAEADLVAAHAKEEKAGSALEKLAAAEQVVRAEHQLREARDRLSEAPAPKDPEANTTDPESRIMKTTTGWIQGYNAQAAVNANQVIVGADVTNQANDVAQLLPMIVVVEQNAAAAKLTDVIGTVTADAGYWSEENAVAPGPDRLIATTKDWKQRQAAREMGTTVGEPPEEASTLLKMEHRLRTIEGAATYATRSSTVEPVFGQAKENRGARRFMRRGLDAAKSEWSLISTTTNILKMLTFADGRSLAEFLAPGP